MCGNPPVHFVISIQSRQLPTKEGTQVRRASASSGGRDRRGRSVLKIKITAWESEKSTYVLLRRQEVEKGGGSRREVERSVVLETLGFDLKVSLKFPRRSS